MSTDMHTDGRREDEKNDDDDDDDMNDETINYPLIPQLHFNC